MVGAGYQYTCGLRTDGTITCWGLGVYDQTASPEGKFLTIATYMYEACGVRVDHSAICWGNRPGQRLAPPGFDKVTSTQSSACAVVFKGPLSCWSLASPYEWGIAGNFIDVGVGRSDWSTHACAIRTDGAIVCWPDQSNNVLLASAPSGTFTQLTIGDWDACAIRTDGTIKCWGWPTTALAAMTAAPTGAFRQVSMGSHHVCALRVDGTIACWGNGNTYGEASPPNQ
jgi:alpha-tubulin suppressor-like RCC1 family protein